MRQQISDNAGAPDRAALQALFSVPVRLALRQPADYLAQLSEPEQVAARAMGRKRLLGFSAGRLAAREALAQLGIHDTPVLIGEKRNPVWPAGVCGSISHCQDQCIAVVTDSSAALSIGVDVEQLKPLSDGVQELVLTDTELAHIRMLMRSEVHRLDWACVLFSIKESLYKCLNPVTGNWIDFHQAEITVHPGAGSFDINLDPTVHNEVSRQAKLSGHFLCTSSHVFSALTLRCNRC